MCRQMAVLHGLLAVKIAMCWHRWQAVVALVTRSLLSPEVVSVKVKRKGSRASKISQRQTLRNVVAL